MDLLKNVIIYYNKINLIFFLNLLFEMNIYKIMEKCCYNNNNSVKCYEYFNNDDNFTIIMELCDMNLSKLLMEKKKKENRYFNSEEILEIMKQLNNAFKIMVENKIIHRDLKLENIVIKKKMDII